MADVPNERVPRPYPAEKARQGEIILKSRWQRVVFIAGLVGMGVLALALIIAMNLTHGAG